MENAETVTARFEPQQGFIRNDNSDCREVRVDTVRNQRNWKLGSKEVFYLCLCIDESYSWKIELCVLEGKCNLGFHLWTRGWDAFSFHHRKKQWVLSSYFKYVLSVVSASFRLEVYKSNMCEMSLG